MTLADLLVQHLKECSSEHCAACDCGWDADQYVDPEFGALAHAQHLADVIAVAYHVVPKGM